MKIGWLLLIACGLTAAIYAPANAAWSVSPTINLPVSTAPSSQLQPQLVQDGAGGAVVVWEDARTGSDWDVYVQHIRASGTVDPSWPFNGQAVCTAPGDQTLPQIVTDGAGGAIITWQDDRSATSLTDIYAQHVLATGMVDPAWPANGEALCTAAYTQSAPTIVSDGSGGAIVTWQDARNNVNNHIYAQHVLSTGSVDPLWPVNGKPVCTSSGSQYSPVCTQDGAGGAIVSWYDRRIAALGYDIYSQHVFSTGLADPAWPANGRAVCEVAGDQYWPAIVTDGAGGAILTWRDDRASAYAQHVLASGGLDPAWPVDGLGLSSAPPSLSLPQIVPDGHGGAIITWSDARSGVSVDIFAQHALASGVVDPSWPLAGRPVCTASGAQNAPVVAGDGAGGVIVTWEDGRSGANIYAQHVLASGDLDTRWTVDGCAVTLATGEQSAPQIVSDGAGGAVVVWRDFRAANYDIFAQGFDGSGRFGNPKPVITRVGDVPSDQGGKVKLSWNSSFFDDTPFYSIGSYWILRSVPETSAANAISAGAELIRSPADEPNPARGAYLRTTRNGVTYSWEYVASSPAFHVSSYSYVAPTTGDSVAAGNLLTAFMVMARAADDSQWWFSDPDSGYSVDNLAPATPGPFAGVFASGTATLSWSPNKEPDFLEYRLYRGLDPAFVPAAGNLIAATSQPHYTDAAGALYVYKLASVDIHGNASPYATLTPQLSLGVTTPEPPREMFLRPVAPNPSAGSISLHFGLPRSMAVKLDVFDVNGRLVRNIEDDTPVAGVHDARWNGTDATGRAASAGLYLVRLSANGKQVQQRLALIR